jgi:3-isopropylmalate/(R)-2-methylmalate dehydratase large subunit
MTLCNMVVEAGGKNGVVPPDSTTYKYLEVRAIDHYIPCLFLHALRFLY